VDQNRFLVCIEANPKQERHSPIMSSADKPKQIVIPADKAVFWLDDQGRWHNIHGPFEHHRISDYFHRAIRWDSQGFHLCQQRDGMLEKVYFKYQDTALFVFEVFKGDPICLRLNTGAEIPLAPEDLYIRNDQLYLRYTPGPIKFNESSLLKITSWFSETPDGYALKVGLRHYPIAEENREA
jgi:hypothetical protein